MRVLGYHDGVCNRGKCYCSTSAESSCPVATEKWIIHNAVLIGCTPLLLGFAAALNSQELLGLDELSGRVPVHVAAGQASKQVLQTILKLEPRIISLRDSTGQLPLHVVIQAWYEMDGALAHAHVGFAPFSHYTWWSYTAASDNFAGSYLSLYK
jgi:hypothetical protein